jgi:serine protease AprX
MATPFVSGTVALALGLAPSLTPSQVKSALMSTADDRGPTGLDSDWGAGLLDGYRFVADAAGREPDPAAFAFPTAARQTGSVPGGGVKEFFFEIGAEDLGIPIAAALTITSGSQICLYGTPFICDLLGGWAWSPDFDAELIQVATNTLVDSSICPLSGECGAVGRQETLRYLPTAARDVGLYKIRVYQFPDDPGGLQEGSVALDLSTGPLGISQPPQPAVAGVTSLLSGHYVTTGKGANKTTSFVAVNIFSAGEEIVLRARVQDDGGAPVAGAVVTLALTGPESRTLTTSPSDSGGMAEARWKTAAPGKGRKALPGTATGSYTATVGGVSATGFLWNGSAESVVFQVR